MSLFEDILAAIALLGLFQPATTAHAAPLPPARVVNHETKQCGEIFAGDECMDCFPPEGWQRLGPASDVACPAGYAEVDDIPYSCQPFKVPFCCSEGHSGAPGDCTDLVINDRQNTCSFVAEIENCLLPRGWDSRPETTHPRDWVCPEDYEWIDEVACLTEGEPAGPGLSLPCLGTMLTGPSLVLLWLVLRPRR